MARDLAEAIADAREHLEDGQRRCVEQVLLIANLRAAGRDTTEAVRALLLLEDITEVAQLHLQFLYDAEGEA